jgi:hypothetical protein
MNENDLIIGMAAGYGWKELEFFVVSLRWSGYHGRCILITDCKDKKLEAYDIETCDVDSKGEEAAMARFRIISEILAKEATALRYVLLIDTKDVVFQRNPMEWIRGSLGGYSLAIGSEEHLYSGRYEENDKVLCDAFGHEVHESLMGQEILNAGVIAGLPDVAADLCRDIYTMCLRDKRREKFHPTHDDCLGDQQGLNVLIRQDKYKDRTKIFRYKDKFVFAPFVEAHGKLTNGLMMNNEIEDNEATDIVPYFIFHQWSRWQCTIQARYCEEKYMQFLVTECEKLKADNGSLRERVAEVEQQLKAENALHQERLHKSEEEIGILRKEVARLEQQLADRTKLDEKGNA